MIPLYAPADVQAMDRRAFARGVGEAALMERAAGHLVRAILSVAGRGYGLRVGILCGRGNNGGDGLAAARRLLDAGAQPRVHVVGGVEGLTGLPAEQLARWRAAGGRVTATVDEALDGAAVAVDCLLGTGSSGAPRGPFAAAVEALGGFPGSVVACDLPTGVDARTGAVPGPAVRADVTVTLGAHKAGLWQWPARGHVGRLLLGELDIDDGEAAPLAHVLEAADVGALVPEPSPDSHKRSRGVVVALAGSAGMTGAATLVGRGAMAAGAGLVTVATAESGRPLVAPSIPEALTVGLPEDDPEAAFERLTAALAGADAIAVGPGLGRSPSTTALVRRVVREVDLPLVLDADGLNAFAGEGDLLADHASPLLVLTPHARELARLVGEGRAPDTPRLDLVPELAGRWRATILAKGAGTLIAAPDGRVWINPTGSAALATGGTGDVLTGVVAALLAQQPDAAQVAAAAWLHGRAGELAGRRAGVRSTTALTVAGALADAFATLDEEAEG